MEPSPPPNSGPATGAGRGESRWIFVCAAFIVIAGAAAYRNSLGGPFVFDDPASILDNPTIRRLWPLNTVLSPPSGGVTVEGRPLLNLTLAINYAIGGTRVEGYHALNLAIHLLAALTLFGLARRTLVLVNSGSAIGISFSIALIWALHPLQTESVTYVIQRAESLMGLLYFLTLYCFVRSVPARGRDSAGPVVQGWVPIHPSRETSDAPRDDRGTDRVEPGAQSPGWAVLSVLACLFGMAAKEVMVSAPLLVFLYDRTFVAGSFKAAWRSRRIFYLGLALTWLLLAWLVHSTQGRGGTAGFGSPMPATLYWTTQAPAIVHYLRLSIWPHPLVFDYAFNRYWIQHPLATIPCVLAVGTLLAATAWSIRRRSPGGFLGVWFFAILAPTSLMPGTRQALAEHRMYVALAPVIALAVFGLHRASRSRPALFAAAIAAVAVAFAVLTARRNDVYRSVLSLWTDTVGRVPDNPYAHNSLACVYFDAGRWDEARKELGMALAINPEYSQAHANLGSVFTKLGRAPEAMAEYAEALRLDPSDPRTLQFRGYALARFGQPERAIEDFKTAIRLKPDYAEAHFSWGNTLWSEGRTQEAADHFAAAVRLRPDYAEAHNDLGNALAVLGRLPESVAEFQEAIRLKPDNSEACNNLAITYAQMGRMPEAVAQFARAVDLDPNSIRARNNYGKALARLGRVAEAAAQYEEAQRRDPNDPEARENLDRLRTANPPR